MNLKTVTIAELLEDYYKKNLAAVLSNGEIVGFVYEKDVPVIQYHDAERTGVDE